MSAVEQPAPRPAPDPWKGLRGVMAGALILQALAVALAFPVVAKLGESDEMGGMGGTLPSAEVGALIVGALVAGLLVAAFSQRRRWGLWLAIGLQLAMVACAVLMPAIGILGVLFALVWVYILRLRRDVARRMAAGQLPSQQ